MTIFSRYREKKKFANPFIKLINWAPTRYDAGKCKFPFLAIRRPEVLFSSGKFGDTIEGLPRIQHKVR